MYRFFRKRKNRKKSNIEKGKYSVFSLSYHLRKIEGGVIIKTALKFVFNIIGRVRKDRVGALSAHAAFFMMVSFVPCIMLLIGMIRYIPMEEEILLGRIASVFPKGTEGIITAFISESYDKSGTALVSVTAVMTLWAASIGVFSLMHGLNHVFCAKETRNFIVVRIVSMFYTLLMLVLFIVCLILFVFGNNLTVWLAKFVPWLFELSPVIRTIKLLAGVVVLALIFLGMFMIVPNRKAKLRTQLPGALLGGIGWIGASSIFSFYIESAADFSYLYGSLSIIVFFMLWLFICIYILYIGAEVNKYLEDKYEQNSLYK